MSNCSKHLKSVGEFTDMKELATAIGDLHYETLADLLKELSQKIRNDARKDNAAGRGVLASHLFDTSNHLHVAYTSILSAWLVSQPYMEGKK